MSRFIFIHDFYRDGYHDMLAEVRVLQEQGLWTKQRRARVTKHEVSCYHAAKHKFPRMDTSYWAGRVAAIKSATTAHYPTARKEARGSQIFVLLGDSKPAFCGSCGDRAIWKSVPDPFGLPALFRCDCCKQETVREHSAYIMPNGWDWDEHEIELLPLPVPQGGKLMVKQGLEPVSIFFPSTAIIGLGMLDIALHAPIPAFIIQAVFILRFTLDGKIMQKFCKWLLESER